jgi:hypothetical protein
MNIIKILAHRLYKLSITTLVKIFCTLIRSVIEYSAIIIPILSAHLVNKLQIIKNNALRTILHVKKLDK